MRWIVLATALLIGGLSPLMAAPRPFRLHCTLNGKPMAEWRGNAVRFKGDVGWATVPPDAAGPMMVLLWAGGARCHP